MKKGLKPFLAGGLIIRNRLDLIFANKRLCRAALARLLASFRRGWHWQGEFERRGHLAQLIAFLRIWRPQKDSKLAYWMRKAMEDFHLLQWRLFGPRLRISKAQALALAARWFDASTSSALPLTPSDAPPTKG